MQLKNRRTIHRGDDGGVFKAHRTDPGAVKVFRKDTEKADDVAHLRVPISSTSQDRDGDRFGEDGLDHMVDQLQSGEVPLFLDHGISPDTGFQDYRALEAIGGWVDGEKEDGNAFGIAALDPDKEEAKELATTLENGVVPMGWSVGFRPTEKRDADDIEGEEFGDHDLLEVSAVGIPSNPDAVSASVTLAAKGMAEQRGMRFDEQQFVRAFDSALQDGAEKQHAEEFNAVEEALNAYEDAEREPDDGDLLTDFVDFATESDDIDDDLVAGAVERYTDAVEERDGDEPGLRAWVEEQRDGDGDDEEDEDEDDDTEEDSAPAGVELSDDQLDALAERTATKLVDEKELVERTEAAAEHGAKQGVEKATDGEQNSDGGDDDDDDDEDDDEEEEDSVESNAGGGDDGGKSGGGSGSPRGMATGVEAEETEQGGKNTDDSGSLTGPFDDSKI